MRNIVDKLINDLEYEMISALQAQSYLEKLKTKISHTEYTETLALIGEYLYDEQGNTEREVYEIILEELEPSSSDWDEDSDQRENLSSKLLYEE
jgi:hypothetical protein